MVLPVVPLFPGLPGGLELLVTLLIAIVLLGLPLFLLVVAGIGYWRLSGDGAREDDETVAELRRRVDEMEAKLTDVDERDEGGGHESKSAGRTDASPDGRDDREDRDDDRGDGREGSG